jgi:hypothetical protein
MVHLGGQIWRDRLPWSGRPYAVSQSHVYGEAFVRRETHHPAPAHAAAKVGTTPRPILCQHLTMDSFAFVGMFTANRSVVALLGYPYLVRVFGAKVEQRQPIRLTQCVAAGQVGEDRCLVHRTDND